MIQTQILLENSISDAKLKSVKTIYMKIQFEGKKSEVYIEITSVAI